MGNYFIKDPDAVLDYTLDWSNWLSETDSIIYSFFFVPENITKESSSYSSTQTTVWLSGGIAANEYKIVNRITTLEGRTEERTITISCKEK